MELVLPGSLVVDIIHLRDCGLSQDVEPGAQVKHAWIPSTQDATHAEHRAGRTY